MISGFSKFQFSTQRRTLKRRHFLTTRVLYRLPVTTVYQVCLLSCKYISQTFTSFISFTNLHVDRSSLFEGELFWMRILRKKTPPVKEKFPVFLRVFLINCLVKGCVLIYCTWFSWFSLSLWIWTFVKTDRMMQWGRVMRLVVAGAYYGY